MDKTKEIEEVKWFICPSCKGDGFLTHLEDSFYDKKLLVRDFPCDDCQGLGVYWKKILQSSLNIISDNILHFEFHNRE